MIYVALLRGINVGGNNMIDMKRLKQVFIDSGLQSVVTYINSGNVIFYAVEYTKEQLIELIEKAILENFQLQIKVVLRSIEDFHTMMSRVPESWRNDQDMKCDVLFLWEDVDSPTLLTELTVKPDIDTVIYTPGAVLWAVDKINVTKSGSMKLVGTNLYKKMTVRNINTARKIYLIMQKVAEDSLFI